MLFRGCIPKIYYSNTDNFVVSSVFQYHRLMAFLTSFLGVFQNLLWERLPTSACAASNNSFPIEPLEVDSWKIGSLAFKNRENNEKY